MLSRREFLKAIFYSPIFADYILKAQEDLYYNAGVYPLSGKYAYVGREIKIVIDFINYLIKINHPFIYNFFNRNLNTSSTFLDDKSQEFMDTLLGIELKDKNSIFIHGSYASNLTLRLKYSSYISKIPLINFISTASKLTANSNKYFARTCASNTKIIRKLIYDFLPKNFNGNFALLHAPNLYGFDVLFNMRNLLISNSLNEFFVFHQPVTDFTDLQETLHILKQKNVKTIISALYLQDFKRLLKYLKEMSYKVTIISLTYASPNFLKKLKDIFFDLKIYYVDHRGERLKDTFLQLNESFKARTGLSLDTNLARIFQGYLIALYPISLGATTRESYIKILKSIYISKKKLFLDWDDVIFKNSENLGARVYFRRWLLV